MISRPLYVPHVGHTWCGRRGLEHCGQTLSPTAEMPCWARRRSRRDLLVFFLGTAIGGVFGSSVSLAARHRPCGGTGSAEGYTRRLRRVAGDPAFGSRHGG